MENTGKETQMAQTFPESLFAWLNSGNYAVIRYSDLTSGWQKPPLRTRLIIQLEQLADKILTQSVESQATIFLVGVPGNGKTHAALYFLKRLLGDQYSQMPDPQSRHGAVSWEITEPSCRIKSLRYIEDATAGQDDKSTHLRFINDIEKYVLTPQNGTLFLCCVNKGILATVLAKIARHEIDAPTRVRDFIANLSSVVSPSSSPKTTWPYDKTRNIYIHPMDEESLLEPIDDKMPVAFDILTEICSEYDEKCVSCTNAQYCPIYTNLCAMLDERKRNNILQILRYYEIVASKRLTFRDLFSVFSQLIVGSPADYEFNGKKTPPCLWVRKQVERTNSNLREDKIGAFYSLTSALYHNRLFGNWDDFKEQIKQLQKKVKDTKISSIKAVAPIFNAISVVIRQGASSSAQNYLSKCASLLDPALHDTTLIENDSPMSIKKIKEYEDAFCKSLTLGVDTFLNDKFFIPTVIECKLFQELRKIEQDPEILDMPVSDPDFQSSQTILSILRIILSRMVKRSVGALEAFVNFGDRLDEYRAMLDNDRTYPNLAFKKRKLCTTLQNQFFPDGLFSCSMLAYLGMTEPDESRGFYLKNKQPAHFTISTSESEVTMTKNLLFVQENKLHLTIKVNFDIYSALIDLQKGLRPASLPARINDIFDGVKARIQGHLCHEWDDGASHFSFKDRDGIQHSVGWNSEEGFFSIEN